MTVGEDKNNMETYGSLAVAILLFIGKIMIT